MVRTETFRVKCPSHIVFGDPSYFEEFTGAKLKSLVVDYKPSQFFEARLVLQEREMEDFPDCMLRTMTLYMAPKETINTYLDGMMYKGQEITVKDIGVDTASYLIEVEGRSDIIHTGGDGYWGDYVEYTHTYREKQKMMDAVTITIVIPESESFESMKQLADYFFEDMQPVADKMPEKEKNQNTGTPIR